VEQSIEISGATIRLGQLLKLAGTAARGAEAKALIAAGDVTVNGEPELRRGRQLHLGDVVRVGSDELRIVASNRLVLGQDPSAVDDDPPPPKA
jgi:ribosome-associated protein